MTGGEAAGYGLASNPPHEAAKKFPLYVRVETPLEPRAVPPQSEGRIAIVTNVERGMRWTQGRVDERGPGGRRSRVVLIPRRWNQVGRMYFLPMTVTKKPDRRGERAISR
jgi:hypothetical protein